MTAAYACLGAVILLSALFGWSQRNWRIGLLMASVATIGFMVER